MSNCMQTKIIKINPNTPEEGLIREAANVLQKGGLVAFPTETVYGIGANFQDSKAIEKLYRIKKRSKNKPFTFHIAGFETLNDLGVVLSERPRKVIHKFWPGPLTIVAFDKKGHKVGIRMPRNKIALALIKEAPFPLVAPSANISGGRPPTSGQDVISEMSGAIDMILDGGSVEIGIESTVVDVTTDPFTVLREGAIPKEDLLVDYHVLFICTGNSCRSVMAKAVLEKFLRESGLSQKVRVDSAGTASYYGIPAAPNTIQVMKELGEDVSMHKGKLVTMDLLKRSDFIYVMEHLHRDIVLNMLPWIGPKVMLLKEDENISDPIGRPLEEYRWVSKIIKDQVENIFLEIFKKETR